MFRSLGQVSGVGLSSAMLQASLNKELLEQFRSPEVGCKKRTFRPPQLTPARRLSTS